MLSVEPVPDSPRQGLRPEPAAAVGLIGPGNVGEKVLALMATQRRQELALVGIANSRQMVLSPTCLAGRDWQQLLAGSAHPSDVDRLAAFVAETDARRRVLVDVTASETVAARHADWLAAGIEVVTANKWAASTTQSAWQRLERSGYYHATTVGAGLPILAALGGLHRAGDRVVSLEGVLSGTLSFITAQVAAGHSFADSVARAHRLGLTEPDPRLDLSGVDVARKLVIAARAGGLALEPDQVTVDSLVPPAPKGVSVATFLETPDALEACWQAAADAAPGSGPALCHVGRVACNDRGNIEARVGLARYPSDHPFARISAGDNIVAIRSRTYSEHPIWIRGPGAGAEVTATQVWSEVIAAATRSGPDVQRQYSGRRE